MEAEADEDFLLGSRLIWLGEGWSREGAGSPFRCPEVVVVSPTSEEEE